MNMNNIGSVSIQNAAYITSFKLRPWPLLKQVLAECTISSVRRSTLIKDYVLNDTQVIVQTKLKH